MAWRTSRIGRIGSLALVGALLLTALSVGIGRAGAESSPAQSIEGAWRAETYELASGASHTVDGLIFFTATDWTVLFFVLDSDGAARRGSAEGGTYSLEDDRLTFRHRYNLSAGEALEGLPASELRMQIRDAADEAVEPCTIELSDERLTIDFPSGNRMTFSRSS